MDVQRVERFFEYCGLRLSDPDYAMTPDRVKEFYAAVYPELTQAVVGEPERRGATQVYKFTRAVGTKGGEQSPPFTVESLAKMAEEDPDHEEEGGGKCPHSLLTGLARECLRQAEPKEVVLSSERLPLLL